MTPSKIDASIGTWEGRQAKASQYAGRLADVLVGAGFKVIGPHAITLASLSGAAVHITEPREVIIEYRAKDNISIADKISRYNETLNEILDLYGLRVIGFDMAAVEKAVEQIRKDFGRDPDPRKMRLRGGALNFPALRDYRKRDWPGISPATADSYIEAIHLNRAVGADIIEVQAMTQSLFNKYVSNEAEAGHDKFKVRQASLYSKS